MRLAPLIPCLLIAALAMSCSNSNKRKPITLAPRYSALPPKTVPAVFKDTILEKCDLIRTEPFLVSGYGLVVNLNNTGDTKAPNAVRDYIVKEMDKHKWGSSLVGIKTPQPIEALRDPRLAIVQVDGYLPPGIRRGQRFDIQVSSLPDSDTTSLAQGDLFQTDLRIMGANPNDPGGAVNVFARAEGPVFVNPAYALNSSPGDDPAAKRSLRMGIIMNGAAAWQDRSLGLRIRQPSLRLSKYIEGRIDTRLQEIKPDVIAQAEDEALISLYVPFNEDGDWEHFAGLVTHLYLNSSPEFSAVKARQLADEAVKPDAPLLDISYAWEGLGKIALPIIQERGLMAHANPDVAFAAARAAAYLGDPAAPAALATIATSKGNKFQVNAIEVLGSLQNSPSINEMMRPLLNSDDALVRIAAYKMLAKNGDRGSVFSRNLKKGFALDVVRSEGPPVIYASRMGQPRLAIIGNRTSLDLPITFSALHDRLTISSDPSNRTVTIFYRPLSPRSGARSRQEQDALAPIQVVSRPDIAEIVARLSGEGFEDSPPERRLSFNYGEVLSILTAMTANRQLVSYANGNKMPASFILQDLPQIQDSIYSAPVIPDKSRPTGDEESGRRVGLAR
jgi:hypothetical protein